MSRLDWSEAVSLLAAQSGVVMLLGATDVGKTTLVLAAANQAVGQGRKAAILDTDLGQSEVGPPGTLGIVRLDAPIASASDLKPRLLSFVGATTAFGHLLPLLQGTHRLVHHSLTREDDVVYVDTSGLVTGRMAEKLKLAKAAILEPSLVVVVERNGELARLAELITGCVDAPLVRVQAAKEARVKSPVYRKARRANRLRKHFEGARQVELDAGLVRVMDAWVYTGTALPARTLKSLEAALRSPVPHGEETADGIYLCTDRRPDPRGDLVLQETFGRKRVTITPATSFQNLMVGLVGTGGHLVEIGLLQGINFERAVFSVLTPARTLSEVRQLHFGRLRVRPDGSEIAQLRPSDL